MTNKKRSTRAHAPSEFTIRWDYYLVAEFLPQLSVGDYVLVEYFGRNRVAVVTGKIPGKCYWAQLCAPVNGQTRVVVSRNTLKGVASRAE